MAKAVKEETQPTPDVAQQLGDGSSQDGPSIQEQAVALRSQTGDIVGKNAAVMQTFIDWLVAKAETGDEDQYAMMAAIVAEIREAQNPGEVLAERSALHVRDILNVPLILHGFEIREGDYEDSDLNFYAALTCGRQGSDHTRVITCGATKVLAKLWRLDEFNEWPQVIWFTGKQTSKGYTTIDMVQPSV